MIIDLERQLDQLEFAPDSAPTQTQNQQQSQQEMQLAPTEEPRLDPHLAIINHTPPPLLLPSSDFIPPTTLNCSLPPVQSIVLQHEETHHPDNAEEEGEQSEKNEQEVHTTTDHDKENHLGAPSMLVAPLSPTMPLNATYIARRSIPAVTPLPGNLLALSSIMVPNTTMGNSRDDPSFQSPTCLAESFNIPPNQSLIVAPVTLVRNSTTVRSSITTTAAPVQLSQRSVSTQTEINDFLTHHPCHDVSECPCVGIYTRSEQLFMTSMAVFFRNSIQVITPPETSSSIKTNRTTARNHSHASINQPDDPPPSSAPRATTTMEEIPPPTRISPTDTEQPPPTVITC